MKRLLFWTLMAALMVGGIADVAQAVERFGLRRGAAASSWHAGYYDSGWGVPVAVVVPPTARFQTHYSWGIGGTSVTPIGPQFQPIYPGNGYYQPGTLRPTPPWPSSTDQLGVYYIRGPW